MVGVHVRDEDVSDTETNGIAHHLPLCAFTTVE